MTTVFVGFSQENTLAYQTIDKNSENTISQDHSKTALSFGFLHGGGSLVGLDFEVLPTKIFGIQVGFGYLGLGLGINIHLKENDIRSSFMSLQFWHQGLGNSTTQALITPMFVFRAKKVFTASVGFGFRVMKGRAFYKTNLNDDMPLMFTFAIGVYFPMK
ncbi:hypothetical protein LJC30_00675 [Odoribacter sp. OttesenSCG-928-L07]|nr:hypothetical protein [Odoribacter sp. OttesenSCG-928-L07]MDL2238731.1 hypothetical protein [Bacteroidales bacterium OttesenSCG-928-L14]MDL2241126.1 hypothetical protein [Bacteroidales bacterium OttesenSCG-928-K22]